MSLMLLKLKKMTSSSALRRNFGMTLGRQLLAALAQFLVVVLIARELGPEGNGFYAMAILLPTMLANFLNLGVSPATVYHVSRKDFNVRQAVAGNLRITVWATAAGAICALPIVFFWGEAVFPGVEKGLLYLGLLSFPLTLMLAYLSAILQGLEDFKAFNLTVLLPSYVNLLAVVIALYLLPFGVYGAMVAYISGQFVGVLIALVFVYKHKFYKQSDVQAFPFSVYSRKTLSYGWKAHLSNVLTFVNYRADIFLVNLFLNPAATGIYVIAVQLSEKIWMISQAASTVLLPRLSAMHDAPEARLALTKKAFWIVAAITAAGSAAAAVVLYWLISPIFGDEYQSAFPAFLWLLPGIIAGAGARIYANNIAAIGKPEWNMYIAAGVVVVNIAGNLLLIPGFGIIGAAWATSIAYCFDALMKTLLIKKQVALFNQGR